MTRIIQIHPDDHVAVVPAPAQAGDALETPDGGTITAATDIPRNHKVALTDLDNNAKVFKYGEFIGVTTRPVKLGEHVHVHNLTLDETTED